MQLSSSK